MENFGGYSDPKVDALDHEIQGETNPAKRDAAIDDVAKIVQQTYRYIPPHQRVIIYSAKNEIALTQLRTNIFHLRWVNVETKAAH